MSKGSDDRSASSWEAVSVSSWEAVSASSCETVSASSWEAASAVATGFGNPAARKLFVLFAVSPYLMPT